MLVFWNCSTMSSIPEVNKTIVIEYKLIDYNGILHFYTDDLKPTVKTIQYCRVHYTWEDIQPRWMPDKLAEPSNYAYSYIVKKNKR